MQFWSEAHHHPLHRRFFVNTYRWLLATLLLMLLGFPQATVRAQSSLSGGFDEGMGALAPVQPMALQADGKILIGGVFEVGGNSGLVRLLADGVRDNTFQTVVDGTVHAIAVQPNGKILVGGSFQHVNNQLRPGLARLNPDGTLDDTFAAQVNTAVFSIVQQPDGQLLIGGIFSEVNGQPHNKLVRLDGVDGRLDTSFDAKWGLAGGWVTVMAVQGDGKVVAGGHFDSVNGQARSNIARFNPDGSLDESFNPGANGDVLSIVVQPDGKKLIGGSFSTFGGVEDADHIVRLNANDTVDGWFNQLSGTDLPVHAIALEKNGDITLGGAFTWYVRPYNHIVRLNSYGFPYDRPDITGNFRADANGDVNAIIVEPSGRILIAGAFTEVNGEHRNRIARLNTDGTLAWSRLLDPTFAPDTDDLVFAGIPLPDGKVLIGGSFTTVGGQPQKHLARLNPDGSLDTTFDLSLNGDVYVIKQQQDGKILIGGRFTEGAGFFSHLARLNPDGSLDTTFNAWVSDAIFTILVQPNDKILIGGKFTNVNDSTHNNIAQLNPDGSLDATFKAQINARSYQTDVRASNVQLDGKILITGDFDGINGQSCRWFARLNPNGSLDRCLNTDPGMQLNTIVVQPDGKVLIGGRFRIGNTTKFVARFHPDGSLDATFNAEANGFIRSIALRQDGTIVIGGDFTQVNGAGQKYVGLLNAWGSTNSSLNVAVNDKIFDIVAQDDGKILLSGPFTQVDGVPRNYIARLRSPIGR